LFEESTLKSVKKRSFPGLDQVDFSMITNLPAEFFARLLNVCNEILDRGGFILDFWKNSLVVLILKAGNNAVRLISFMFMQIHGTNIILQTKLVYRVAAFFLQH